MRFQNSWDRITSNYTIPADYSMDHFDFYFSTTRLIRFDVFKHLFLYNFVFLKILNIFYLTFKKWFYFNFILS